MANIPLTGSNQCEPHQFQTFNDDFLKQNFSIPTTNDTFPLFSHLPLELRLKIWTMYLISYPRRNRFLRIDIQSRAQPSLTDTNDDHKVIDGQEYRIFLRNPPRPCVLSMVCTEAAGALSGLYRIRLPCYLNRPSAQTKREGYVLLNPEWDILDVHNTNISSRGDTASIIHFLHDLKSRDPGGTGALNLSLDTRHAIQLAELNIRSLSPRVLNSYRHTIASLNRLFWRATPSCEGRVMSGYLNHRRTLPWYNVSMPLMANSSSIDFVGLDPRPFQPDLHQVWVGEDPRGIPIYWRRIEEALGVRAGQAARGQAFQCRILVALETWREPDRYSANPHIIVDRTSAIQYLRQECESWDSLHGKSGIFGAVLEPFWYTAQDKYTPDLPPISPSEVITTRLDLTAIGFWLFEPTAFSDPNHDHFTSANVVGKTVVKLVGKHPELCLFGIDP